MFVMKKISFYFVKKLINDKQSNEKRLPVRFTMLQRIPYDPHIRYY